MSIAVVTDSTAYFTNEETVKYNFTIVPLTISFEEENFPEGTLYSNKEFYAKLRTSSYFPTTSQPAVGEFVAAYTKLLEKYDEVVSIHLSGGLSGTVRSAANAAEMVDKNRITVIDSLSAAQGLGAMVAEACKMSSAGSLVSEIVARINIMINNSPIFFLIEILDYLHKGGRIGGAATLFGNLLQIKPLLYFNTTGKVDLFEKIRTEKKAEQRLIEISTKAVLNLGQGNVRVIIAHADNLDKALRIQEMFTDVLPDCQTIIGELGPVIGMHGGPGTVGFLISPQS